MLTKQDLNLIREVVKEEIKSEIIPVRNDIKKLRKDLTKTINFFDKSNIAIKKEVNRTRKDVDLKEVEFAY